MLCVLVAPKVETVCFFEKMASTDGSTCRHVWHFQCSAFGQAPPPPQKYPDLSLNDFFLWGHVKKTVYRRNPKQWKLTQAATARSFCRSFSAAEHRWQHEINVTSYSIHSANRITDFRVGFHLCHSLATKFPYSLPQSPQGKMEDFVTARTSAHFETATR
jgi:hypothetical protein